MHTRIVSAATIGIDACLVDVEVDLSMGLMQFHVVGLPDAAIKESRQRVVTALKNCGIRLPERKITVNLAPADLKKEGALFDLPIALGILHAAGEISVVKDFLKSTLVVGELSLDGTIRPIRGMLPIARGAYKHGMRRLLVPAANAEEAAYIEDLEVFGFHHLSELVSYIRGDRLVSQTRHLAPEADVITGDLLDYADVIGQVQAKRALQIAAAGRHNILFIGSPGSGKTMLAQRLPSIMPSMTFDEMLEVSAVFSVSGKLRGSFVTQRPFRAPHHTISAAGLVGGGSIPQPGEISLAHHGILFLDEFVEFRRSVIELLRQPLESKEVAIARAQQSLTFPASFLLVAALNPCPCGYRGDKTKKCVCSDLQVKKYLDRLSGPLLDRIDVQVAVQPVAYTDVAAGRQSKSGTSSQQMRDAVLRATKIQKERFGGRLWWNAWMSKQEIDQHCALTPDAQEVLARAFQSLALSMRGYHKLLKVSRTIADLDGASVIDKQHVQEAILFRSLEQYLDKMRGA